MGVDDPTRADERDPLLFRGTDHDCLDHGFRDFLLASAWPGAWRDTTREHQVNRT